MYRKEGKGKITVRTSGAKKKGKKRYRSFWLYIPKKLSKDSSFPFDDKDEVSIVIEDGKMTVSKIDEFRAIINCFGMPNATLPKLLEKKAKKNQHKPLLYFQDQIFSYITVNSNSNEIANGIIELTKELQLKKSKIALLFQNCPEFLFCWFGIIKAGCVLVPIDISAKGELLKYLLKQSDAEILIIDYKYFDNFKKIENKPSKIKKVIVRNAPKDFKFNDKYISFQKIYSSNSDNPKIKVEYQHEMEIIFTSGTTGKPKGVLYRHFYTLSGPIVGNELKKVGINSADIIYCPFPLFHAFAQLLVFLPAIYLDASVALGEKFQPSNFWDETIKYNASVICYFGRMIQALLKEKPKKKDRDHNIRLAYGGGAYKEIWESFESRFGIQLNEGWSLTETVGYTVNPEGTDGGKIGSCGKLAPGFKIKICDEEGNELPSGPNNIGEIYSKSPYPINLEYYNTAKVETKIIQEKEWYHTRDMAYKDKDGYIYFVGRISDMITKDGQKFSTLDIEKIANTHPFVIESAAFGVPNKTNSEYDIKLTVVLKEKNAIRHEELYNYLRTKMAYFLVPRYIEFKEKLPKTLCEQIKKLLLKEEWEENNIKVNTWDANINGFLTINTKSD